MNLDQLSINSLRVLSADAVEKANSGHPGLPLGAAPMAYSLWARSMKHNPRKPDWLNRDRFVLSAGHGSALLYSLLHLFDYGLTMEDLKEFRQLDSKTPGHPEYGHTVGIETTTGPLGQGISTAVGMAMAEAHLAARFNKDDLKVIDHYSYVLVGDGDLMEGVTYEACSLAGTLGLGKLIVLYDSNSITIEGSTDLAFTEDVKGRFLSSGWQVLEVADGNNIDDIEAKIEEAKKESSKPAMIIITTEIGYGAPTKQGQASSHGAPLGADELAGMKEFYDWKEEKFVVPSAVKEHMEEIIGQGEKAYQEWVKIYQTYKEKYPEEAKELESWLAGDLPLDYLESDDFYSFEGQMATRVASGQVIERLADRIPNLIGGSADLAPSNNTYMKTREDFSANNYAGSNIRFGVREHAMAAILNGLYLHGGLRPYVGTFFVFSDYMKPSMRLAALMNLPVTYVLTHDSIGVGEDGPTHQPVDHLAMLRAIPNFVIFRPADARETAAGWKLALTREEGPTGLALTRQNLPLLDGSGKDALKGGYILKKEKSQLDLILLASGSEVQLINEAADILEEKGIGTRVVSMPSFQVFEDQEDSYKEEVLPSSVRKRLAVEAASAMGWHKYVGLDGNIIAMEGFGASAPGAQLFEKFGFTVENVVEKAEELMK